MIKVPTMRKRILALTVILLILLVLCGCSSQGKDQRLPVRVLLLPKFELGEMEGDFPGEAQCFYMESVDIFETAMQNCFAAGKVWIDLILKGTL